MFELRDGRRAERGGEDVREHCVTGPLSLGAEETRSPAKETTCGRMKNVAQEVATGGTHGNGAFITHIFTRMRVYLSRKSAHVAMHEARGQSVAQLKRKTQTNCKSFTLHILDYIEITLGSHK